MRFAVRTALGAAVVATLTAGTFTAAAADGAAPRTEGLSVTADGKAADERTGSAVVSRDGRYAAFDTAATDLVPGDTNGVSDVFVRALGGGELERISQDGRELTDPAVSGDGRYVAMVSTKAGSSERDIQLYDRESGAFERLDVELPGDFQEVTPRSLALSADGRYAVFEADGDHFEGSAVFLRDRTKGTTERVSHRYTGDDGEKLSHSPTVSDGGRYVAYEQSFGNGPRGDDWSDIWVRDRETGKLTQADRSHDGSETEKESIDASISADGSKVVFESRDTHLVPDDEDASWNVFVHDVATGENERIHGTHGGSGAVYTRNAVISADGEHLVYMSQVDQDGGRAWPLYLRDLATGDDQLLTPNGKGAADGTASPGAVSEDATEVAFLSADATLLPEDTNDGYDAFVRHLD
ncbi:translocation protein TolB [Streptomyces sp. YIM 130001]|uniref:TolB family protein n=1 Tax=Streptomyces sp. YIM 130001 TaxID=2259644 RepID=UPI000E64A2AC|nr:PD40 domain-containing protein [Streptomyces sp. YIM 130001]RII15571.1 translocation protein TolB [Streptomyces sp. YIM 130001]